MITFVDDKPIFDAIRAIGGPMTSRDVAAINAVLFQVKATGVIKPLFDATLDELAFAAQTLNAERSVLSRRMVAIEDVYAYARKQGFLGADLIRGLVDEVTK